MKIGRRLREPIVAIAHGGQHRQMIEEVLDLLPLMSIIKPDDTVVVVPNWVGAKPLESGAVTRPETLHTVLRALKALGPRRLVVAAGPAYPNTPAIAARLQQDRVIREEEVEFVDLNLGPFVEHRIEHDRPSSVVMNRIVEEMNVLVSLTQLKMHEEATVSLTMKNVALSLPASEVYGYPRGEISGIPRPERTDPHADLHGFIVAMNKLLPIDLAIIVGDIAMTGTGPSKGRAVEGKLVIAGTDAVATDVVGARLLGFKPQGVAHIYRAIAAGLGEGDVDRIRFLGARWEDVARRFTEAAFGKSFVVGGREY